MTGTGHLSVQKGKRIRIIFFDGRKPIITKFIEKKGSTVKTKAGDFKAGEIKTITIYKPLHHER